MGTRPQNFRKTEAVRLALAAEKAGLTVTSIEVDGSRVKVNTGKPEASDEANPWEGARDGAKIEKRAS
jgi:hypothetical protein